MASDPVESVSTFIFCASPRRMIEPSPNCFVMALIARSTFLRDALASVERAAADALAGEEERAMGNGSGTPDDDDRWCSDRGARQGQWKRGGAPFLGQSSSHRRSAADRLLTSASFTRPLYSPPRLWALARVSGPAGGCLKRRSAAEQPRPV